MTIEIEKDQRPTSGFARAGVYARSNFCADFQVCPPPEHLCPPPERQDARRYRQAADRAQCILEAKKDRALLTTLAKSEKTNDKKMTMRIVQKYFTESWLLPCSLRSHRTVNPRPKMGFAIFRLYTPTTLRVADSDSAYSRKCKLKRYDAQ